MVNGGAAGEFTLNKTGDTTIIITLAEGMVSGSADGVTQGTVKINDIVRSTGLETTDNVTFNSVTTAGNVNVGGDLIVNGTVTNVNTTDLNIEDKFILLGSGSSAAPGDSGIVFEHSAVGSGSAFGYDQSEGRFGFDIADADATTNSITFDAFAAAVVTAEANTGSYEQAGNIYVDGTDIFIYV